MGFMDNFRQDLDENKRSEEAFLAMREAALTAVSALLDEVIGVFGKNPEAEGIILHPSSFRLQDRSGFYEAKGLEISFPGSKAMVVRPEGLAFGGFSVSLEFKGCVNNGDYYLLFANGEGRGGRGWCFRAPVVDFPRPKLWSKEILEELLDYHILGKAASAAAAAGRNQPC